MTLELYVFTLNITRIFNYLWEYLRLKILYSFLRHIWRLWAKWCWGNWHKSTFLTFDCSSYLSHISAIHPLQREHQRSRDWYQEQFHLGKCRFVRAEPDPPQRSILSDTHIWCCRRMWSAFRPNRWPWDLWRLEEGVVWGKPPNHKALEVGNLVPNSCPINRSCCNLQDVHRLSRISLPIHICTWETLWLKIYLDVLTLD